jgi:exodeoxyribonuclease VII small subunit
MESRLLKDACSVYNFVMAKKKINSKKSAPAFEESLEHLKQCLQALESQDLTLDQSLECYESGIGYLKQCHQAITTAKQRVDKLVKIDADGNAVLQPFDNTASEKTTSGTRRDSSTGDSATTKSAKPTRSKKSKGRQESPNSTSSDGVKNGKSTKDEDMDDSGGLF